MATKNGNENEIICAKAITKPNDSEGRNKTAKRKLAGLISADTKDILKDVANCPESFRRHSGKSADLKKVQGQLGNLQVCHSDSATSAHMDESVSNINPKLDFFCDELARNADSNEVYYPMEKSPKKRKTHSLSSVNESNHNQIADFLLMGDEELMGLMDQYESYLDLEKPTRCEILDVDKSNFRTTLVLKSKKKENQAICKLEGFWANNSFNKGDIVSVSARRSSDNCWTVNNDIGWIVYEPDLLISCTSVVGSLFCKRRGLLKERYQGFEPTNKVMVIGVLVHTLLQTVLQQQLRHSAEIQPLIDKITTTESTIRKLYESGMTLDEVQTELRQFVPRIEDFMRDYVLSKPSNIRSITNTDWSGMISSIEDIEDNFWCTELGIKGKVDVTVRTNKSTIMPLELKTGRASSSLEHKGQIILYLMMMNKMGYEVSSGLLLYLREGVLKEISTSQMEKRDLIILRNELAYYLNCKETRGVEDIPFYPPELPEPINHPSCNKCPYAPICSAYLEFQNYDVTQYKYMKRIRDDTMSYLSKEHVKYFMHWSALIGLEAESGPTTKSVREIYTVVPAEREKRGRCLINLKLADIQVERNGLFKLAFRRIDEEAGDFLTSSIGEHNYIVISTNNRPAVATGFVTKMDSDCVVISTDRDLSTKYPNNLFHVDTYDSSNIQTFSLTSLSLLLEDSPRAAELRKIVIDKAPATFLPKLPTVVAKKGAPILRRLNRVQQRAVLKALSSKDYLLINGLPGTGKTATIVALIQLLVELNKTVLITSHTHSAIDNVCLRLLKYNVKFLRLGSNTKIHEKLESHCEHHLTKNCKSPEEMNAVYNSFAVIAVTCLGSGHPLLSKRTLDVCIVDESTQVLQTAVIKPLYSAKAFILIGDHNQLPPVIKSQDAVNAGMSESLFERLNTPESSVTLNLNYRMNRTITDIANKLTYKGELKVANDAVGEATLQVPRMEVVKSVYSNQSWLLKALDTALAASVKIIDTGRDWKFSQNSNSSDSVNQYEAAIVTVLVEALIKGGVPGGSIGVIATYRDQVAQISKLIQEADVSINTVDQFQGQDKSVVIYSCTKSRENFSGTSEDLSSHILNDKRRLTVAITRAKHKLIIVGDLATVRMYETFKILLDSLDKDQYIYPEEMTSFDPNAILGLTT